MSWANWTVLWLAATMLLGFAGATLSAYGWHGIDGAVMFLAGQASIGFAYCNTRSRHPEVA